MYGDGPWTCAFSPPSRACAPHVRGWTAKTASMGHHRQVCPASTGMDRCGASAGRPARSVPRMHGDGPDNEEITVLQGGCTPHARGWTDIAAGLGRIPVVYPACTGMDRLRGSLRAACACVPRMYGDGPVRPVDWAYPCPLAFILLSELKPLVRLSIRRLPAWYPCGPVQSRFHYHFCPSGP